MITLRALWNDLRHDQAGFIISAELVLVLTIGVLAIVVGLNAFAKAINQELFDLAGAFGAVSQSFFVSGFVNEHGNAGFGVDCDCNSYWGGFGYVDQSDECDCAVLMTPVGKKKWDTGWGPGSGNNE